MHDHKGKNTLILDLGNVVLDFDVDRIVASLGLDQDTATQLRAQLFAHPDWIDLDHGIRTEAEVIKAAAARSGLDEALFAKALGAMKDSLEPIPETLALMHEASNADLRLYCLSNMSRETWAHIREQDLFDLFDGIVISGHERCLKPDARIFELLLERFSIDPANALFVDDSPPNVATAASLGIDSHCFRRSDACYTRLRDLLFG